MHKDAESIAPTLSRRQRLLWSLAATWTAIVLGTTWLVDRQRSVQYLTETVSDAQMRVDMLHESVESNFHQIAALAQVLARQAMFESFLRRPGDASTSSADLAPPERAALRDTLLARPDVLAMSQQLETVVKDFQIRQAFLLDANGTVLADSGHVDRQRTTVGAQFGARQYLVDAMEQGRGFQFVMGSVSQQPGFNFAARVAEGERALGVLVLKTDPAAMTRIFSDAARRTVMLTDGNGVVVAGNRPEHHLRQIPMQPYPIGREAEMTALYRQVPRRLDWAMDTVPVGEQSVRMLQIDDQTYAALSHPLPEHPYTAWVLAPLTRLGSIHASSIAGGLAVLLAGLMVLWMTWRRLEHDGIVELAHQDALESTEGLPLTVFRYRIDREGEGRFSFVGPGVKDLFGVELDELLKDPQWLWSRIAPGQSTPPTEPVEFSLPGPGHRRWIGMGSTLRPGAKGEQVYEGYWQDRTALRQTELRFDALFDQVPVAVMLCHRERGILRCNNATLELFAAHSFEQLRGRQPWKPPLTPPQQTPGKHSENEALAIIDKVRGNPGEPLHTEWHHTRLDGTRFQVAAVVISLDHEVPGLVMGVLRDVTAQRQTDEALRKAEDAAQSSSRAKTAFLANMSHEIRTPMNTIMGMTHLALEDTQPDKHRGYVAKAHQAAKSMLQIVNDILDLSRIEAGQLELECIEFPVQGLIDQLSNVLGLQAEQKGIELLFTAPMDLPTHLLGDPTRVRQILLHLGANAIKHTSEGSVTLGLEVRNRAGYEVELHGWVRDTGEGMGAEQQVKLMQSLTHDHAPELPGVGGAGLGLTICQQLLERMSGRLWVEGALGRGCTFHFTFKISLPSGPAHAIPLQDNWHGKRILLADDNPDAREVLGKMLTGMGLIVDLVGSGPEAIAALERSSRPYDWIMLDWKMPGMDGIHCASALQSHIQRRFPGTQPCILLVTAFNRDDAVEAARGVRLADVLTKPITPAALADCLRKTLTVRPLVSTDAAAASAPPPEATPKILAGTHILLVEDQPLNQELARELLQLAGATVVCCENGALALTALARNKPFDCVLMDCQMPVMDGYTATRKIRQQPQWQHLPIIAMTASALASDREHALGSGMNDHITKPLDIEQMYQVISKWVSASKALQREAGTVKTGTGKPA